MGHRDPCTNGRRVPAHRYVYAVAAALLLSMALSSGSAAAQTRTPPEATQHALDELANAMAQGKVTRAPTPSATATSSPTSTPRPQPTAVPPTDTPVPTEIPRQNSEPSLPVPNIGQSLSAYVRASPGDPDGAWLELALPQGRWAILYDTSLCTQPSPWTNVWLARDEQKDRLVTIDRDDAAMCALAQWSWTSDVPCATDEEGTCDVERDGAYWDAIAQIEPTPTETPMPIEPTATDAPIASPTPTPIPPAVPPTPLPSPRPPAPPPPIAPQIPAPVAAAAPPATVAPPDELVVLTVVVFVTPWPTATPTATWTATATPTPPPTSSPTLVPTANEAASLVADVSATQAPAVLVESAETSPEQSSWNWTLTIVIVAVALGLVAIWLFVVRGGPVMW